MQELETRLRQCELQGVEATAEVQQAARRVADENRSLRLLLHRHGVHDDAIDMYLRTGVIAPAAQPVMADPTSPHQYRFGSPGKAVRHLERLMTPRHAASSLQASGTSSPESGSTEASVAGQVGDGGRWEYAHADGPTTPRLQRIAPAPISRSLPGTPGLGHDGPDYLSSGLISPGLGFHHHQHMPFQARNIHGHIRHSSEGNFGIIMHSPHGHLLHGQSAASEYCPAPGSGCRVDPRMAPQIQTPVTSPTGAEANCRLVTEVISAITHADPDLVRASMGCPPGMDCVVDAPTFHRTLDRFSALAVVSASAVPM